MKKLYKPGIIFLVLCLLLIPAYMFYKTQDNSIKYSSSYDTSDTDTGYDNAIKIDLNNPTSTTGVTVSDSTITITLGGTYYLSGTYNGEIIVDAKGYEVHLVLDNVNINSTDAAIHVVHAKKTIITLVDGSTNTLTDGNTRSDSEINACLFSKDDLTINGNGTLVINGNYQDGIVSKDILRIISGTYQIKTVDDSIRGTDAVMIQNGNFTINSDTGCGIKSTQTDDTKLGYIIIDDGTFDITCGTDGIQAVTEIILNNGTYKINSSDDAIQGNNITINNGTYDITTGGGYVNARTHMDNNMGFGQTNKTTSTTKKNKGIKAENNVIINGGTFTINAQDDAVHGVNVTINNAKLTISAGDDAVHADTKLIVNADIDIKTCYEGLEGNIITINGGNINIISSDDGMNGSGSNAVLTINDGTINVNAQGDGLDSNGSIYMNGGNIIVNGPTENDNGALDYDSEFIVTGGTLVTGGSSGMMQTPSTNSAINTIAVIFTSTINNQEIKIMDSDGNTLVSYTPTKDIQAFSYTSSNLKTGSTYTVYVNGNVYTTLTISGSITQSGNSSGGMQRGMMR